MKSRKWAQRRSKRAFRETWGKKPISTPLAEFHRLGLLPSQLAGTLGPPARGWEQTDGGAVAAGTPGGG